MTLFLDLPDALCSNLLTEWVTVTDWGKLEIVVGNIHASSFYVILEMVSFNERYLDMRSETKQEKLIEFYRWAYLRGIRMNTLILIDKFFSSQNLRIRLYNVVHLDAFDVTKAFKIDDIVNSCSNLRLLRCKFEIINFVAIDPEVLSGLTHLDLIGPAPLDLASVMKLRDHCHKLHSLAIHFVVNEAHSSLVDLCRLNIQLKRIRVHVFTVIRDVLSCSPTLTSVHVLDSSITLYDVMHILEAYPQLAWVEVYTSDEEVNVDPYAPKFVCGGHRMELATGDLLNSWIPLMRMTSVKIEYLQLDCNDSFSDAEVMYGFERIGSTLKLLMLDCLQPLYTEHLMYILSCCSQLTELYLNDGVLGHVHWTQITFPKELRSLHLNWALTVEDIIHILSVCRTLELLFLNFTNSELDTQHCEAVLIDVFRTYQNDQGTSFEYEIAFWCNFVAEVIMNILNRCRLHA